MPVVAQTAQAIADALTRMGLDVPRLGVGAIHDDEALAQLWDRAIARVGRRTLPLEVGLALPLGAMGAVDYLAASSATVGAALAVTQQTFPLVAPGVQLQLERLRSGARRVVVIDHPPFPGRVQSDLLVVGILLNRLRRLASRVLAIPAVELSEPEPTDRDPWARLLGSTRMRFGARRSSLVLSPADWSVALRTADGHLLATLKAMVGVEQRGADALLVAVRSVVQQHLPRVVEANELAPAIGMSVRTLQRKLAASGTSVSQVVDDLRRDRAEQLVKEGVYSLGEVAASVGFAQQASFTRAWKRWFGGVPSKGPRSR